MIASIEGIPHLLCTETDCKPHRKRVVNLAQNVLFTPFEESGSLELNLDAGDNEHCPGMLRLSGDEAKRVWECLMSYFEDDVPVAEAVQEGGAV
jgi:hypothetical protein